MFGQSLRVRAGRVLLHPGIEHMDSWDLVSRSVTVDRRAELD